MSPKLTYLPCRGRCDPVLLLYIDANAPLKLRTITYADWIALKDEELNVPPHFPFGLLPTLEVPSSLGDKPYVLAESGSILRYVEATLRGQHLPAEQPVAKARHEMLAEAATFAMLRWFACAEKEDWLEPASIAEQLKTIILPFLNALEHHMSASMFPPLVVAPFSPESGRPGTTLNHAAACCFTFLDLCLDLLPRTMEQILRQRFPHSWQLFADVSSRPRIAHWRQTAKPPSTSTSSPEAGVDISTVRPRDFVAVSPYGSYERISAVAARDRSGELKLDIDFSVKVKPNLAETQ